VDVKLYINERPPDNTFLGKDSSAFLLQNDGDLGQKMQSAISSELKNYEKVIIIGSDCPEISAGYLLLGARKLDELDVVIGPAEDGGYCLLGLTKMHKDIFSEIEWSSGLVASTTIKRLISKGESVFLLPSLGDVDSLEDWKKYESILT
jgi:rSAM/selenodomain-associated transferase 1